MFSNICKVSAAALCVMAGPALADWNASAISLGANTPGATGQVDCVPGGSFGSVWGTGTYTSDSSVCTAAVHFGWMTQEGGGQVTFRQVPGLPTYPASTQNGVTSLEYGSWDSSFQITGMTPLAGGGGPVSLTWDQNPDNLGIADTLGTSHTFVCPPIGAAGATIWGTDVYTSDSSICTAALHRGHVSVQNGGVVTVLILGEQPIYNGSARNGVDSADYPAWPRSFTFQ